MRMLAKQGRNDLYEESISFEIENYHFDQVKESQIWIQRSFYSQQLWLQLIKDCHKWMRFLVSFITKLTKV